MGHHRLTAVGARGRDVHDAAPARLDHVRQHDLAAVEGPGQVHGQDPVPGLEGDVEERLEALHARVVDEDVDRPEALPDLGERGLDRGSIRHVHGDADRAPSSSPAADAAASPSRSRIAVRAPSRASRWLMPKPMPDAPPVTTATLPLEDPSIDTPVPGENVTLFS